MIDAEGRFDEEPCPACGSTDTITYHYREGFTELTCRRCGFTSDAEEIASLQRFEGDLLEGDADGEPLPAPPTKPLKA